jgi:uncharacterized membrane protein
MSAAVWMVLAVGTMLGIFVGCVAAVVLGVRLLEHWLARHRAKRAA